MRNLDTSRQFRHSFHGLANTVAFCVVFYWLPEIFGKLFHKEFHAVYVEIFLRFKPKMRRNLCRLFQGNGGRFVNVRLASVDEPNCTFVNARKCRKVFFRNLHLLHFFRQRFARMKIYEWFYVFTCFCHNDLLFSVIISYFNYFYTSDFEPNIFSAFVCWDRFFVWLKNFCSLRPKILYAVSSVFGALF